MEDFKDKQRTFGDDDDNAIGPLFSFSKHTRLFFPMIEEKWNIYMYPYATATFSELLCLLRQGGSLDTFIYTQFAIASLLIKTILEQKYKEVVICFSNAGSRSEFRKKFKRAVDAYHQTVCKIEPTEELQTIGGLDVSIFNRERLLLSNSFVCEFVCMDNTKTLRGFAFPSNDHGFTIMDTNECSKDFLDHVVMPLLCLRFPCTVLGIERNLLLDSENKDGARQARRELGHGNRTLKMGVLSFDGTKQFVTCDNNCRSCKYSKETWDDEIANFKSRLFPWARESPIVFNSESKSETK